MTSRSLFNLILKISGIFFIGNILGALSRSLSVLVYFPQYASHKEALLNLGVTIPPLILYTLFVLILIFRTDAIIDFFKLDKGINEQVSVRLHRSVILSIAVIVAGGWLLISGLPEFIRQGVYYYQERKLYLRMARPDVSYFAMSIAKLLIGTVLIAFNRTIVNIIEVKRKNQNPWHWPARIPFSRKKKKAV